MCNYGVLVHLAYDETPDEVTISMKLIEGVSFDIFSVYLYIYAIDNCDLYSLLVVSGMTEILIN